MKKKNTRRKCMPNIIIIVIWYPIVNKSENEKTDLGKNKIIVNMRYVRIMQLIRKHSSILPLLYLYS